MGYTPVVCYLRCDRLDLPVEKANLLDRMPMFLGYVRGFMVEGIEMNAAEKLARSIFPDPIRGSYSDSEDFEWRKEKARLQRSAFVKGFEAGRKSNIKVGIIGGPQIQTLAIAKAVAVLKSAKIENPIQDRSVLARSILKNLENPKNPE